MKTPTRLCFSVRHIVLPLFGAAFLAGAAQAGTVITTNLPAGVSIVNINARTDGAASFSYPNPPQAYWYQPSAGAPSLTLQPGTYQFRIVNPVDAAALYPSLTGAQLSQIYTGWTFNSPWTEDYFVFNSTALSNPSEFQLFDGALAPAAGTFGSAAAAYSGTVANGYYNKIRPAPPGRAGTAADYLSEYTFNTVTTALFVIPDNILVDNAGGVSVVVSQVPSSPVPVPAAGWLLGSGLAFLSGLGRFRKPD